MSEWNDGYILEGQDRCHTILVMIDNLLYQHPAVIRADVEILFNAARNNLIVLYQQIGNLDFFDK